MSERPAQSTIQDIRFVQQIAAKCVQAGGNVFVISIQVGDVTLSSEQQANALPGAISEAVAKALGGPGGQLVEDWREHELQVFEANGWNREATAKALGISARTFRNHVAEWKASGVDIPDNRVRGAQKALPEKEGELWNIFCSG